MNIRSFNKFIKYTHCLLYVFVICSAYVCPRIDRIDLSTWLLGAWRKCVCWSGQCDEFCSLSDFRRICVAVLWCARLLHLQRMLSWCKLNTSVSLFVVLREGI